MPYPSPVERHPTMRNGKTRTYRTTSGYATVTSSPRGLVVRDQRTGTVTTVTTGRTL